MLFVINMNNLLEDQIEDLKKRKFMVYSFDYEFLTPDMFKTG